MLNHIEKYENLPYLYHKKMVFFRSRGLNKGQKLKNGGHQQDGGLGISGPPFPWEH